jgi:DNA invertase Pin-like site-specific DNA recombinase
MSAFSELEREMIVERVVGGVRKAQAAGKHCGRPRRIFRRDEAARLREEGKSWAAIGRILGVPAGTVRERLRKPSIEPSTEIRATAGM